MTPNLRIFLAIFGLAVIFAVLGFFYIFSRDASISSPLDAFQDPPPPPSQPGLSLTLLDEETLLVGWSNLPDDTKALKIYRSKTRGTKGPLWNTLNVDTRSGFAEVPLQGGDGGSYYYYTEGVNGGGGGTWNFPSSQPGEPPPPPPPPPDPPPDGSPPPPPPPPPPGSPPPPPGSPPPPPPPPPPGSPPPPPGSPPPPPPPPPPGSPPPPPAPSGGSFGANHLNDKINLWWENLLPQTTSFIIYRSESGGGPWNQLLKQTTPRLTDSVSFLDLTIHEDLYYRMEAYEGELVIQNYGPVLLMGLPE